jgi:CRISPR system Cascade subunit CasA
LERWTSRFDLFDAAHPFYQAPSLDFQYAVPISKLAPELTSGNNPTLFDHSIDQAVLGIPPATAARWLVAHQGFAVGGLVSLEKGQDPKLYKSADAGPLAKGAFALLKGHNLFETLMLNLHRYSPADSEPFSFDAEKDVPAWERDDETRACDRRLDGLVDLLTWQSRRIRLRQETDDRGRILIRAAVIMKGNQFPDGFSRHGKETMLAFESNPKAKPRQDPWPALAFREDRALWRDSLSLFESARPNQAREPAWRRPKTLNWISDLASEAKLNKEAVVPLDLMGLCTDRAKVLFWRHERLPLMLQYLDNQPPLLDKLKEALKVSEDVARHLRMSSRILAKFLLAPNSDEAGVPQPNVDEINLLADNFAIERSYWPRLGTIFNEFLKRLARDVSTDGEGDPVYGLIELPKWCANIRGIARAAFRQASRATELNPRSPKAIAQAELYLWRRLAETTRTSENEGERDAGTD